LAFDCLNSIPLNVTSAKNLIKAVKPWMEWQSTLTVLKNPPVEYAEKVQPPIDILGGLDAIDQMLDSGEFESEYAFGNKLYTLILAAHDGHFSYIPDSVGGIFTFGRKIPLVSVSEDGKKLPMPFVYQDILGMQFKNISYKPSPVVEIDGQDATSWLENWSQVGSLQDRDALYNNAFYNLAQISLGSSGSGTGTFSGGGRGRFAYPGQYTVLKFANGSVVQTENYARALISFRGIDSGNDLQKISFIYEESGESGESASSKAKFEETVTGLADNGFAAAAVAAAPPGYPAPVVPGPYNLINGYYINAPGYEHIAVLSVPNFVGDTTAEIQFQNTTKAFLAKATADGKRKLIIDLQANGGGTILQGYDMFKQLFPTMDPYGGSRFRAHEAADLIGQSFSGWSSTRPRVPTANTTVKQVQASFFDYRNDHDEDVQPFTSWQDKYGPVEHNGDKYTEIVRWNLTDIFLTWNSGGINITGYGALWDPNPYQPFASEDIVLVTDGYCASTCTIFAEFMKQQAGVSTIAMGGRSNAGPIQAIGGVKGVNNFQWGYITSLAQLALKLAPADQMSKFNSSAMKSMLSYTVFNRAGAPPGVNVRDGVRKGDKSGTALQFVYEEADCRLYYTPEMTVDASAVWKAAADAKWGKNGKCVTTGYGINRRGNKVTKSLDPRRVEKRLSAQLMQKFKESLDLETDCKLKGDGFMQP
jgi:hypothetical protein